MTIKDIRQILSSELFSQAVSTALKTQKEIVRVLKQNVKNALHLMNVPSGREIEELDHKIGALEKTVDRLARKIITVRSLKKISAKKKKKK